MHLPPKIWEALAYVASFVTNNPFREDDLQQALPGNPVSDLTLSGYKGYPEFPTTPPLDDGGKHAQKEIEFNCTYPQMEGWHSCSTEDDRECWIRHPNGSRFDINTNYEIMAPIGVDRYYEFDVTHSTFNADGIQSNNTKLVNGQYPGPWIQACWGDRIHVTVHNKLRHNGTAIHWHGIRMLNEMHADGVPGITQCPIAPGESYTYNFSTVQYGTSWYHSHYSVQYADGLLGPITIHGPSSAKFDVAVYPTLMTDWFHNSAFQAIHNQTMREPTILLDGRGDAARFYNVSEKKHKIPYRTPPPAYELKFEAQALTSPAGRAKRYLLRLINTSFDTTFIFSIDNHILEVISADFVPIVPYNTSNILIGIGQRYNVIVEARPIAYPNKTLPPDGNYWIRTHVAKCFGAASRGRSGYEKAGVIRYDNTSTSKPESTQWDEINQNAICSDELMKNLKPKIPWNVTLPSGNISAADTFGVLFGKLENSTMFPLAKFSFEPSENRTAFNPLQIAYGNPIIQHLGEPDNSKNHLWPFAWVVVPEDQEETDWVFIALTGSGIKGRKGTTGAHPIHLHGHDFAILQQEVGKELSPETFDPVLNNPPRRDVVLLPSNGFVIIAFKADNPGSWIMHCHIAFHASFGLALQVLERQSAAHAHYLKHPQHLNETSHVCDAWKEWEKDCCNWWPGLDEDRGCYPSCPKDHEMSCPDHEDHVFMDDSSI